VGEKNPLLNREGRPKLLGREPRAYEWRGKLLRWLRTEVRHPVVTRIIGHWVFHKKLPKEWARALYEALALPSSRWFLFERTFTSLRQCYGFFVWLLKWALQRWLGTGRVWSLEEVWEYAVEAGRPAEVVI